MKIQNEVETKPIAGGYVPGNDVKVEVTPKHDIDGDIDPFAAPGNVNKKECFIDNFPNLIKESDDEIINERRKRPNCGIESVSLSMLSISCSSSIQSC